jgi:hypothetical protein
LCVFPNPRGGEAIEFADEKLYLDSGVDLMRTRRLAKKKQLGLAEAAIKLAMIAKARRILLSRNTGGNMLSEDSISRSKRSLSDDSQPPHVVLC